MRKYSTYSVAPYVGAWIETPYDLNKKFSVLSHPTWVRGLKQKIMESDRKKKYVAPYVGAWIETLMVAIADIMLSASHPTWVRGLKLLP